VTRIVIALVLLFSLTLPLHAQRARQYSFNHFTTAHGLASNFINGITQDKDGYIWLGTKNGLQRYDGNRFLSFRSAAASPRSIPTDDIASVFTDHNKNVWLIASNNAVGIFDTKQFVFRETPVLRRSHQRTYTAKYLFEGADGSLMLLEEGSHLYKYDAASNIFQLADDEIPSPKGWNRTKIFWDGNDDKYWICGDSGILNYNPANRHLNYRGHNRDNDPVIAAVSRNNYVFNLMADRQSILYSTWAKDAGVPFVYKVDKRTGNKKEFLLTKELQLGYHEISNFLTQREGRLWIFGHAFLAEWTDGTKPFIPVSNEFKNEQSIRFDYVYSGFEDNEKNIWLATDNGVFVFNPDAQLFNSYDLARPGAP
jgi:ligand-binding sensor domain-containing protein